MESKNKQQRKIWTYVISAVVLTALGIALQPAGWKGTAQLHTLMELAATMLAMTIGVVALIRFYSKKQNTYLFVGIGFFGTAFLDGYHAVVTSSFFSQYLPSGLAALIPWSWNASRTFLAVLMVLSLWAWRREQRLGAAGRISERLVYIMVGALTLASFLFFTIVPLPRAYYPEFFFGRPEEFVAGALFLVALMGYLQKAAWRNDQFENWLVISLVFGVVCQVVVMSRSFTLFDSMFDLAHSMKVLSYLCVLTGLFINTFHLFGEAQRSREAIAESNAALQHEIKQRGRSQNDLIIAAASLQEQKDEAEISRAAAIEQAARIKGIVDSATDAIISINPRGIIESFNAASENLFGYELDEVIGENIKILMPEPYQGEHDGYLKNYMDTGEKKIIGIGREAIGMRKDGSTFPMELAISEVQLEDRRLFTGIVRDITERKLAETALQEQAARIKGIVDSATDAIISINPRGIIESFNTASETLFGYELDEVIGENIKMLMPAPYQGEHDGYLKNYTETGVKKVIGIGREAIGMRKDGSTFPMELAVSEVQLGDRRLFTGIVRDITERKLAEVKQAALNEEIASQAQKIAENNTALKNSNNELKQFAYVASHDLQEPLRKVNSFCQLLQNEYADQLDDDAKSYIRYAVDGATRMRALVADLLDYSRVETQGKQLEPTDADEACAKAIEILQAAIEECGAKVIVQQQLPTILADRTQLVSLFQNLISNAIKYRGESSPEIEISVQPKDHDWVIAIRDNGIGMEPQYYERIFVMFQRLHARNEYSGTGIGLAICKRIVDRLRGTIWVESEPGAGSTFFISIPKLTNIPAVGAIEHEHSHPVYAETH